MRMRVFSLAERGSCELVMSPRLVTTCNTEVHEGTKTKSPSGEASALTLSPPAPGGHTRQGRHDSGLVKCTMHPATTYVKVGVLFTPTPPTSTERRTKR